MRDVTQEQFLTDVWGEEPGTVYLATKQSPTNFRVTKPIIWPVSKALILGGITQSNANWDTYYTPGIFKEGTDKKSKENGWRAHCLWLDIDGYKDGVNGPQAVLQMIAEMGWFPMPTYQIQTSDSFSAHFYWILDDYYPAEVINDLNRRLAYFLGGDTSCWDISHVMRPPGTHNHKEQHKIDGVSPKVTITHYNGEKHGTGMFLKMPPVKEQLKDFLVDGMAFGTLPTIEDVKMRYPFDKDRIEAFNRPLSHFWDEGKKDWIGRGNAMVYLAYFGAEIGMSDEALYVMLMDMDDRWEKFKDRNDRQVRIVEIIAKVRNKYPSSTFTTVQEEVTLKPVYRLKEFLASEFKFNWIYEDVVAEQSINFISARPGTGKSRFIIQLARALALGIDFLTWKLVGNKPRKAMIFSLEMGAPVLKKFLQNMARESTPEELELMDENFLVIPAGEPLAIATPEGEQFFQMVLKEYEPEVVIIDAMGSLDFEELNEKTSKKIMTTLKKYLNSHGITFYIVHHNKKADAASINKPPTLNDFYGNTYASTDASSIMALWKNPNSSVELTELHTLKSRLGVEPRPIVLDSHSHFMFSVAIGEEAAHAPNTATRNEKPSFKPSFDKPSEEPASKPFQFNFL